MKMLPLCSATSCFSSNSQISVYGFPRSFSSYCQMCGIRCNVDRVITDSSNQFTLRVPSFRGEFGKSLYSLVESHTGTDPTKIITHNSCQNELRDLSCVSLTCSDRPYFWTSEYHNVETGGLKLVENPTLAVEEGRIMDLTENMVNDKSTLQIHASVDSVSAKDVQDYPAMVSDSLNVEGDSVSNLGTSVTDSFSELKESITDTVQKGENAFNSSLSSITSSVTSALKGVTEAVDNSVEKIISVIGKTGEVADTKMSGLSSNLKEASGKIGIIAIDILRKTILVIEDSLSRGATVVVYVYGSAKELLPPEIQDVISSSEERATKILSPVGAVFKQAFIGLEGLEKSVGLDPSDPIVPFVLFVGASATLWGSYQFLTYGGYAGDLSAEAALELLTGNEDAVLVDIRPEDLRERDGIPDLRRAARFRYANVFLPKVDGSLRRLLKSGKDLDDTLLAAVIQNLKTVQGRSKVIVMDADGTYAKSVARSLRKLGTKRPYLVQGGFRSWVKEGLRIKELKPETTLTILNEEAEAILEEISPTPLQLLGFGAGVVAAAYALAEWEKTLQFIGVLGLTQTVYRRLASYENSEDLKQDVRLLVAPARLGGQAISWAVGKLETNRNGLPTSPSSSSDIKNRVLQAAAKHESQPSDEDEAQDLSPEQVAPVNENVDLSEA